MAQKSEKVIQTWVDAGFEGDSWLFGDGQQIYLGLREFLLTVVLRFRQPQHPLTRRPRFREAQ